MTYPEGPTVAIMHVLLDIAGWDWLEEGDPATGKGPISLKNEDTKNRDGKFKVDGC